MFNLFIENYFEKILILTIALGILLLITRNIKLFVLVYVATRSLMAAFYNINIFGGLNILDLVGFIFPTILLFYWIKNRKLTIENSSYLKLYLFVFLWLILSTIISKMYYGFSGIESLAALFRLLNGLSVFIVFPLIFKDNKDIGYLINAFFIATFFPLFQGIVQIFFHQSILGMNTSFTRGDASDYLMYFGLYHKYDGYAWAALLGGLILIYKICSLKNRKGGKEIFYISMYFLYLTLASLTLSRTLIFSLAIISFFIFLSQKINLKKAVFILVFLILALNSGFIQDRYEQFARRSESEIKILSGEYPIEYSFHGRGTLWVNALSNFNRFTFINRLTGTNLQIGPHSDYIQWLVSYGYIGLVLYILLLATLFVACMKRLRATKKINKPYQYAFGLMTVAGLIVWIIEGIVHNVSHYVDYSYFIIGNAAIFLKISRINLNMISRQKIGIDNNIKDLNRSPSEDLGPKSKYQKA